MSRFTNSIARSIQRHQNLLIIISLVLVALPFVALSCYNHPSLDDFLDAVTVKELGFWKAQRHFYYTITGRYTTTVLLAAVNPLIYGHMEGHWWPVALGFILGTLLVCRYCITALPGVSRTRSWQLAGLLLALWLAYAPGQSEGLYWFTGAYTYITTAWILLLWLAVLARYLAARQAGAPRASRTWLVVLGGLTVAVAGTTEPIALPFLVSLLAVSILSWWQGWGRWPALLAGLALAGCIVSFLAPGNAVRMATMAAEGEPFGVAKTLVYSAAMTGYLLLTWVGNPVLLTISALLIPLFYRLAQQREQLLVRALSRVPVWLLAGSLGLLLTTASCPAFYASGTGLPLRARNTLYLLFLAGWFGVLLTWCCRQAGRPQPSSVLAGLATGRLAPLWVGLTLLFFVADHNVQTRAYLLGHGSNNAVRAYQQWLSGEAARYDAELRARYHTLNAGKSVVIIHPLRNRPDLLFSFGVADASSTVVLQGYARYFGVARVVVEKDSLSAR